MTDKIQGRFLLWLKNNPEIYNSIEELSIRAFNKGKKQYSIWAIVNHVRWGDFLNPVKIDNRYTPLLARRIMKKNKQLKGFFKIKPLKGE